MSADPSDRLEFIHALLCSAPAGQFNDLLDDIQKLSVKPLEGLQDFQSRYESLTCSSASTAPSHPLAARLQEGCAAYQSDLYGKANGVTARRAVADGAGSNEILLRTYAERVDDKKSRTGSWMAEWTVQSQPKSSTAEVYGQVRICVFSYEDGNVQLRSTQHFATQVFEEASDADLAKEILKQIGRWETQVLESLSQAYDQVGAQLRALRGILPITRTRMNWNVVARGTVRTLQETINKK